VSPTPDTVPTQALEVLAIHPPTKPANTVTVANGNWNIRANSDGTGASIGVAYDGAVLAVVGSGAEGWLMVQTVEEDPADVVTGYISVGCCQ
jgi:hypothetical protein